MRCALVVAIVCSMTGCQSGPLSDIARSMTGFGSQEQSDVGNSPGVAQAADGGSVPHGATGNPPSGNPFVAPTDQPITQLAQALDQLQQQGNLTADERREFETNLAAVENDGIRSHIIELMLRGTRTPPAATSVADPGITPASAQLQQPANAPLHNASGPLYSSGGPAYGAHPAAPAMSPNSLMRLPEPPSAVQPPVPERFSYADEIRDRLPHGRDEMPSRYGGEEPWDPRGPRAETASYQQRVEEDAQPFRRGSTGFQDDRSRDAAYAPGSWEAAIDRAIADLQRETQDLPRTDAEIRKHAMLRMLHLVAGNKREATRPIEGIPASNQDFWINEIYGLATYLDETEFPTPARRAEAALEHFREAETRLGELANLEIRNPTFCREVKSYGVVTPFAQNVFRPQELVLLYAEIENFKTMPVADGYRTELRGSYVIQNEARQRVAEEMLDPIVDVCGNPRRDFFINYFVTLPTQIFPGKYDLILNIEDMQGRRFGTATIPFEIGKTTAN